MGWIKKISLILIVFFTHIRAQYVIRNSPISPASSYPIVQSIPANQYLTNSLQANNIGINNRAFYNNPDVNNALSSAIGKLALATDMLSNINYVFNEYVTPAERLARATALAGMKANKISTPLSKLRVPIVRNVPPGALLVAKNLPLANPIPTLYNGGYGGLQVLGKGPVNYQSITRPPFNNVAIIPTSNVIAGRTINGIANVPYSNNPRIGIVRGKNMPLNNARYVTTNNPIDYRLPANLPVTNIIPNNVVRPPCINSQIPANLPVNTIANLASIPINRFASLARKTMATLPIRQLPLASPGNRVVANVPVVPMNSLAGLPVYNGLPVIQVRESVYKLTPL